MAAIDFFASAYGTSPWLNLNLYWMGTADSFALYEVGSATPLVTGTGTSYAFTGNPDTRYDFRLEATVGAVVTSAVITAFTRPLPAPINLASSLVADDTATLAWTAVAGATGYDVADVTDSYTVIASPTSPTYNLTGLTPSSRCSYAVRTKKSAVLSRWSDPVSFTTLAPAAVVAGAYEYTPDAIHTWYAGRAPITADWLPTADDWYHGDGLAWGDANGSQTTFFFYTTADFAALATGTVTAFKVYLERSTNGGDPGLVLSRWWLHDHASKPVSNPIVGSSYDSGSLGRGQSGWLDLPLSWADSLIDGSASGIAWGGVAERFQVARNVAIVPGTPRTGDLKITVS